MRKLAPLLDLEGNVRKAKRWIPWAQQQMRRLKGLNVDELVNQTLKPINGCIITLKSVLGNDYIRINVLEEEGCKYDWDFVINGYEVTFNHNQNECDSPYDSFFWDFGDGQFSELGDTTHDYTDFYNPNPVGDYVVTLYSFTRDIPNLMSAVDFGLVQEKRQAAGGSDVSHAAGWAAYAQGSNLWVPQGGSETESSKHRARYSITGGGSPVELWYHISYRNITTVPLSQLAANPAVIAQTAFIFLRGGWHIFYESSDFENENVIFHPISGTDIRDYGMQDMRRFYKGVDGNQEFLAGILDQDVPLVDGVFCTVDDPDPGVLDTAVYAAITLDPKPLGRNEVSWFTWSSFNGQIEIIPYIKKKIITKTITLI
jgi:hypothetical protein